MVLDETPEPLITFQSKSPLCQMELWQQPQIQAWCAEVHGDLRAEGLDVNMRCAEARVWRCGCTGTLLIIQKVFRSEMSQISL